MDSFMVTLLQHSYVFFSKCVSKKLMMAGSKGKLAVAMSQVHVVKVRNALVH